MSANLFFLIQTLTFSLAIWLGTYLLGRDRKKPGLQFAGYGSVAYALALAAEALQGLASPLAAENLRLAHQSLIFLPAIFWGGALLSIIPEEFEPKEKIYRLWVKFFLPIILLIGIGQLFFGFPNINFYLLSTLPLLAIFILFIYLLRRYPQKSPLALLFVGIIFFGLSVGLFLPQNWIPREWMILAIGFDLSLLSIGIAKFDAFEEGQKLSTDMLRNLQAAFFTALLFGGQVVLVIVLSTGLTFVMAVLLMATITTAILFQSFSIPLQNLFDRMGLSVLVTKERTQLRATADQLTKLNPQIDFSSIDFEDFSRLTRKALSHMIDLPRLASNPLTHMPLISSRLNGRNSNKGTLDRANELKLLLSENIQRLKPKSDAEFGDTDDWRYFNALYFPYVVGIKATKKYRSIIGLTESHAQALEYFQTEVPERTLHNWQKAGAKLIAQNLWEQMGK